MAALPLGGGGNPETKPSRPAASQEARLHAPPARPCLPLPHAAGVSQATHAPCSPLRALGIDRPSRPGHHHAAGCLGAELLWLVFPPTWADSCQGHDVFLSARASPQARPSLLAQQHGAGAPCPQAPPAPGPSAPHPQRPRPHRGPPWLPPHPQAPPGAGGAGLAGPWPSWVICFDAEAPPPPAPSSPPPPGPASLSPADQASGSPRAGPDRACRSLVPPSPAPGAHRVTRYPPRRSPLRPARGPPDSPDLPCYSPIAEEVFAVGALGCLAGLPLRLAPPRALLLRARGCLGRCSGLASRAKTCRLSPGCTTSPREPRPPSVSPTQGAWWRCSTSPATCPRHPRPRCARRDHLRLLAPAPDRDRGRQDRQKPASAAKAPSS